MAGNSALALLGSVGGSSSGEDLAIGEDLSASLESRQYQRVLSVAASQERRLVSHRALRKRPGYDLSDPWLVAPAEQDESCEATSSGSKRPRAANRALAVSQLQPGMPCAVAGTGEIVAYLGAAEETEYCKVRLLKTGEVCQRQREQLMAMPTRAAKQGDLAIAVDLAAAQAHLNGRQGLCGLPGVVANDKSSGDSGFWVMFQAADALTPPEMVLIAEANLVALPGPPVGAPRTPWESRQVKALADGTAGGAAKMLALPDEAAQESRLALRDDDDDEDDSDWQGSEDLSDDSEEDADDLAEGALVRIAAATAPRSSASTASGEALPAPEHLHGRIEGFVSVSGGRAPPRISVRLLNGSQAGSTEDFAATQLQVVSEGDLEMAALCTVCGRAEPEDQLLLCDNFCEKCLFSVHIGCLDPPLSKVPKDDWYCSRCRSSASSSSSGGGAGKENRASAAAKAKAEPAPAARQASNAAKAASSGGKAPAKAAAAGKPKAKGKAPPPAPKAKAKTRK
eukprot:TRINITY_DN34923_c0_g1_i1.p1 TRINITY_DN34923_c0_g1~~TRINITY_DN34923_c0_g1_i1.p1  ORF type:complete len:542 (+),score=135.08 TRINITY_DN34923_c0_g1_i1:96-1628(+)